MHGPDSEVSTHNQESESLKRLQYINIRNASTDDLQFFGFKVKISQDYLAYANNQLAVNAADVATKNATYEAYRAEFEPDPIEYMVQEYL